MNYEIIGIGSALVDVTLEVKEDFLARENLPKGGMTLVDAKKSSELLTRFQPETLPYSPGGATANVMASFAICGGKPAFIGKVGKDPAGVFFHKETEKAGVSFLKLSSPKATGVVTCFLTPDGQRTFATHLGAAVELDPADLPADFLHQAPLLHLEAYLLSNKSLIEHILRTGKANGQILSLDLSSFNVVMDNLDYLHQIIENEKLIDIIFANEEESHAYTGKNPEESLDYFSRFTKTAVVKVGGNGSYLCRNGEKVFCKAEKVNAIDTNGAGDAYAGGVLFGLLKGLSLEKAGKIGSLAGGLVVSQKGARLTDIHRKKLNQFAQSLL